MSISGIGGSGGGYAVSPAKSGVQKQDDAIDAFLKIARQTPAERLQEAWLRSHNLSKEKLAAMTPEQRETVMKQMAGDVKKQLMQAEQDKRNGKVNILV